MYKGRYASNNWFPVWLDQNLAWTEINTKRGTDTFVAKKSQFGAALDACRSWIELAAAHWQWHRLGVNFQTMIKYQIMKAKTGLQCVEMVTNISKVHDKDDVKGKRQKYVLPMLRNTNDSDDSCFDTIPQFLNYYCRFFLPPWRPGQPSQPLDRLRECAQEEETLLKISTSRTRERIRLQRLCFQAKEVSLESWP